jgi:hypothetical protein
MISLIEILKKVITEGGNVFTGTEYDTDDVLLNNIKPTVEKFVSTLSSIFPKKKSTFTSLSDSSNWLGSTGKKPKSGDVDLAYSSEYFFNNGNADIEGWGIDSNEYNTLYEKNKKAARSASDEQIQVKSLIQLIVKKINESGNDLYASDKAANGGTIHFSYPQYSPDGKKLDANAQLDLDTGDMDWLKFRYNSELPDDNPEIKGLHRGQLMLAMFAATGYTFKNGKGFIRKETGEIIGSKPQDAIDVFNDEYKPKQPLDLKITSNYNRLMDYIKTNLKPEDKENALKMFVEALRRAKAYVPNNI